MTTSEPFTIQGYTFPPLGEHAYMPVVPVDFRGIRSMDQQFEVVGESRYVESIRRVAEAHDADPDTDVYALLVSEPGNPFDRHAVRVDLFLNTHPFVIGTCGYLPREQAYKFTPGVRERADSGFLTVMAAHIFGGTREKPNFGVWLGGEPKSH